MKISMLALAVALGASCAAGEGWTDDFEAAKAKAQQEGKDLLLDFTGSDWCSWCVKLREEVFDTELFKQEATKKFVLVELDYPKKTAQAAKLRKQNAQLRQDFRVRSYPTVYLLTAQGVAYGRAGYQPGGPERYLQLLAKLQQRKAGLLELRQKADAAKAEEKARLLDQLCACCQESGLEEQADEIGKQIEAADPTDKTGLKAKYVARAELKEARSLARRGDYDAALEKANAVWKGAAQALSNREKQQLGVFRAQVYFLKKDEKTASAALKAARDIDPASEEGQNIAKAIAELEGQKATP